MLDVRDGSLMLAAWRQDRAALRGQSPKLDADTTAVLDWAAFAVRTGCQGPQVAGLLLAGCGKGLGSARRNEE
jgi:hypothetical protein